MKSPHRARNRVARSTLFALAIGVASSGRAAASPVESSQLLLSQGHEQEAAGNDLVALKRYADAIDMDPTDLAAYLAMGAVRERRKELAEADAIYSLAIAHVPHSVEGWVARGELRRGLGRVDEATHDLSRALDGAWAPTPIRIRILRDLASIKRSSDALAEELVLWRMMLDTAERLGDPTLVREASVQARAIGVYLGEIDPAHRNLDDADFVRRSIAVVARRHG